MKQLTFKMPKALSLKQPKGTSKSQGCITQYFKKRNEQDTSNTQINKVTGKRKAISPIASASKISCSGVHEDEYTNRIIDSENLDSEHSVSIKSSSKVNLKIKNNSPSKANISKSYSLTKEYKQINNKNLLEDGIHVNRNNRSCLTPVYNNDTIDVENESREKLSQKSLEKHEFNNVERNVNVDFCMGNTTPKKSPSKVSSSPRSVNFKTSHVVSHAEQSPSKQGSTVKTSQTHSGADEVEDLFSEEWADDIACDVENLDLSTLQRCEIISIVTHPSTIELKLKNGNNNCATCFVEGIWLDTPLTLGDVISVIANRNSAGQYSVSSSNGLLVLRPDHLMSSTSVVAGVFCRRKATLQERWRGIDSANSAMTLGILIHELVQESLTQKIMDVSQLHVQTEKIIRQSLQMLYDANMSEEEVRNNIQPYIHPLADFMKTYLGNQSSSGPKQKDNWKGHIDKVLDIEENLCCPQLGLKGKIDATLEVTIHERNGHQKATVPLEIKSGKATMSAEHRGQLVMYGMILSALNRGNPATDVQKALLLYLRDRMDIREVSCGYPERRDLVLLRNQLVQCLANGPNDIDPEECLDIEEAAVTLQQNLPEPVHHQTACSKCPYLTVCSLHLWHTHGHTVSENHPLAKLKKEALGFLTEHHVKYFLEWNALLKMEEKVQLSSAPLHSLWTNSVDKRETKGTCCPNLTLEAVEVSGNRHLHTFTKQHHAEMNIVKYTKTGRGPQEGEFSIVSINNRPWVAAGVITTAKDSEIQILLERDLSKRLDKSTLYHIDTYESYATTVSNLTNLGVLVEDSERADRLRRLIIDKESPQFDKKLPREVGRLGTKLMKSLNIEQQRAVLKALASKDYALLQGLPGTGKTQTISVLIQMLVGLKQRVLVTAHTHSAVDTVLNRLPNSMKVMRLGSSSRVSASLQARAEQTLVTSCGTVMELTKLYESMEVVGVTCLGAAHAMLSKTIFDVCIVDEATQVLQCTVLRPLFAAKRFVLVGDPDQLPPVVKSRAARRLGMEESLFHRLMNAEATSTLQLQYRMNQPIVDIANKVAYSGKLKCANEKVARATMNIDSKKIFDLLEQNSWLSQVCSLEPEDAVLFIDTSGFDDKTDIREKSLINTDEACIVIAIAVALIKGGVLPSDIGVIAPYRDQVSLLRRCMSPHDVEVSTVDQFQGRDKSVIIYSCTKRNYETSEHKAKEGEVLNDQRRLAVSVTRAKHKLLVVGNSFALRRYQPVQRLIEACNTLELQKKVLLTIINEYKPFLS